MQSPHLPPRKPPEDVLERPPAEYSFTPEQLREVALGLRQYAARFVMTEIEMTAFLDRADEIRTEAWNMEARRSRR